MPSSNLVGDAFPYTSFEDHVETLSAAYDGEDIFLVYSRGEWDIRIGDPSGFSESVANSAFECVLDLLDK